MEFHEGQSLWFVQSNYWNLSEESKNGREVVVEKLGRKWITLSNSYRIDINTLQADGKGYSSPGQCYLSHHEFMNHIKKQKLWNKLKNLIQHQYACPEHLTVEALQDITDTLGKQ